MGTRGYAQTENHRESVEKDPHQAIVKRQHIKLNSNMVEEKELHVKKLNVKKIF